MKSEISHRILLVEDDETFGRSVQRLLELNDLEVDEVSTVDEAIDRLATSHYDLVMTDLRLTSDANPGDMSGLLVAEAAQTHHTSCIILTAYRTEEAVLAALQPRGNEQPPPANDVVFKGSGPSAIIDAVTRSLRSSIGQIPQKRLHLLLAENNQSYRRSLRVLLELEDYEVAEASNPDDARSLLESRRFDLALLDLRMSDDDDSTDMSGLEVAKQAAEDEIPSIILTAFPSFEAVRQALRSQSGKSFAVDFVPKANDPQAVLDAIRRAIRRADSSVSVMPLEVDLARQVVRKQGSDIDLSRLQYALIVHLYQHRGAVCPPEDLIRVVYGDEMPPNEASADKRLERLIARLREKIEDDPSKPAYLLTVPGRGYRLEIPG